MAESEQHCRGGAGVGGRTIDAGRVLTAVRLPRITIAVSEGNAGMAVRPELGLFVSRGVAAAGLSNVRRGTLSPSCRSTYSDIACSRSRSCADRVGIAGGDCNGST